eukprot:1680290-Pyramimonas_sp.AAC.1
MFPSSTKFENLEEERQLNSGTALSDFRVHAGERIDQTLARLEIARYEANTAVLRTPNFHILTAIIFRVLGVGTSRAQQLLQPLNHRAPRDQQQVDALLERMRSYANIAERNPGNIGGIFSHGRRAAEPSPFTWRLTQGSLPTASGMMIHNQLRPLHCWLRM